MKKILIICICLFFIRSEAFAGTGSSIIFIPGFQGTRLHQGKNQLWEPNRNADVEKLYLNEKGESLNEDISVGEIIKKTNIGLGAFDKNIYQGVSDYFDSLVDNGTIKDWKALPYDWRLDLPLVDYLYFAIRDLAETSYTGKVVIVGHSNGGLMAKKMLSAIGDDFGKRVIDSVVLVATPQIGAPAAAGALLHGDEQQIGGGFLLSKTTAQKFGQNMPGAYNLLPSGQFYTGNNPLVRFSTTTDLSSDLRRRHGDSLETGESVKDFLIDQKLNPYLLDAADDAHELLDNMNLAWPSVQIGGTNYPTTDSIEYFSHKALNKYSLDHRSLKSLNGDGTVPIKSALFNQGSSFVFDMGQYNKDTNKNISHATILEAVPIQELITSIIERSTSASPYIKEKVLPNKSAMYRYGIHSPVTLDAYDEFGRHTGKKLIPGSDFYYVEESIPNSVYEEAGEGKYIHIKDPQGEIRLKMKGTDQGAFSFDIVKITQDKNELLALFEDVPIIKDAGVELTMSSSSQYSLSMDMNNDGTVDQVIENKIVVSVERQIAMLREEIKSLKLSPLLEKLILLHLYQLERTSFKKDPLKAIQRIEALLSFIKKKCLKIKSMTAGQKSEITAILREFVKAFQK